MEVYTKKTTDLSIKEKEGLVLLYNDTFDEHRTIEEFDRQFLNNPIGFSYHTIGVEDGIIISSNTMIPSFYRVKGELLLFVCSVDTMVDKKHRGLENFYDTCKESFKVAEEIGAKAVYGFPNDNSYKLFTGIKLMRDIGKLKTYCLPYRIGGIKRSLRFLNWASIAFCQIWMWISSMLSSKTVSSFEIEKDSESYNATRYNRADGNYSIVDDDGNKFVFKIMVQQGIRTAFIVDVFCKSSANFCSAIKHIIRDKKNNFDLILYVGDIPFKHFGMICIPKKYEPKEFNFTGSVLDNKAISKETFFCQSKWDVNLSNYDLL